MLIVAALSGGDEKPIMLVEVDVRPLIPLSTAAFRSVATLLLDMLF